MTISRLGTTAVLLGGVLLLAPAAATGQDAPPVRSLVPLEKRRVADDVPSTHRPPPGMCRVWIDNVPPAQQPAPTDCPSAIRNRPPNARVIFADDAKGSKDGRRVRERDDDGRDGKRRKPDG